MTDVPAIGTRPAMKAGYRQWSRLAPPVLSVLAGLLFWHFSTIYFEIPSYVLPAPADVFRALVAGLLDDPTSRASFLYHLADTLRATLIGFVIGGIVGVVMAAIMAESELLERLLLPYFVGLQSLPKVAIAPLFVIWFGYQIESKVAMAATLTLFPVLLNSAEGFRSIPSDRLELMASVKANRLQVFYMIKLPTALPFIFAGLNLGIVYAQLGAIVSEFIGAQRGMGVIITQLQTVADTAGVFAALTILAVTGYLLITAMRAIQHRVVFWARSPTGQGS